MAKSISEEELQLKKRARRRLIGAIALVVITAVFLPMVLEHEPKPVVQNIDIQIPSPDNAGAFTSKIVPVNPPPLPVGQTPATAPESVLAPVPSTAPVSSLTQSAPTVANPVPIKPPQPVPVKATDAVPTPPPAEAPKAIVRLPEKTKASDKPKTVDNTKAAAKPKQAAEKAKPDAASAGFVVQVAALNDAAKAGQIAQQMSGAGIKTFTEIVPTTKGKVTRVRAGPFKTREEAEQVRDRLKSIGLTGNIVPKSS